MATGPRAVILCKRICFLTPSTQVVPRAAGGCQPAAGRRARPEPSLVVTQRDSTPEASEAHQAKLQVSARTYKYHSSGHMLLFYRIDNSL